MKITFRLGMKVVQQNIISLLCGFHELFQPLIRISKLSVCDVSEIVPSSRNIGYFWWDLIKTSVKSHSCGKYLTPEQNRAIPVTAALYINIYVVNIYHRAFIVICWLSFRIKQMSCSYKRFHHKSVGVLQSCHQIIVIIEQK